MQETWLWAKYGGLTQETWLCKPIQPLPLASRCCRPFVLAAAGCARPPDAGQRTKWCEGGFGEPGVLNAHEHMLDRFTSEGPHATDEMRYAQLLEHA
jgi:hypothetical protein